MSSQTNFEIYRPRRSSQSRDLPTKRSKRHPTRWILLAAAVFVGYYILIVQKNNHIPNQTRASVVTVIKTSQVCQGNSLANFIEVSISQRHMWACQNSREVGDWPVITGMAFHTADVTPVGTYHIYAKHTNLYLDGSDSTGSWHDYVYYWLPFLTNQYGEYGFHDATWRPKDAFGHVSQFSQNASHGCVEIPIDASRWLYNWAPINTTVTILS